MRIRRRCVADCWKIYSAREKNAAVRVCDHEKAHIPFFRFARHEFEQAIGKEEAPCRRLDDQTSAGCFLTLHNPEKSPNVPAVS